MNPRQSSIVDMLLAVFRVVSILVPRGERSAWVREWSAEVHHASARRASPTQLLRRVAGAPIDALALRVTEPMTNALLVAAAVGLFGVIAYGAAQRTHEFGVRLAFGARPSHVARALLRESVVVVLAGAIGGLLMAWPAVWFIGQGLTTVRLVDPLLGAGALALLFTVSLAAALRPMRRATRIDPITALRAD